MKEHMRDAAFASNIDPSWTGIVAGYLRTKGDPFNPWTKADWERFSKHRKLPIFVQSFPDVRNAEEEAFGVLKNLYTLGVPKGCYTAIDLETAINAEYVTAYGSVLRWAGYKVFVYGSASTVFNNPPLNGYWVADYAGIGPFMYKAPHVRLTQYTDNSPGGKFDSSTMKSYLYYFGSWWK